MSRNKLIYGTHSILEALDAGKEIDKIFIRRGLKTEETQQVARIARERVIPMQYVPSEKLDRLTTKNHQGIVAFIAEIEYTSLEQLIPIIYEEGRVPFFVILDGITDVRNFGAIARTAECTGVDAIIIPDKGSVSVTGDAIKTSAGALHRVAVCRVNSISHTIRMLQDNGIKVVTASEKSSTTYTEESLQYPCAIVMGSEEVGPSEDTIRLSDSLIRIPQVGSIGSLNVSVAAGVILYECLRQNS